MLLGQTVIVPTTATTYYSPWYPRRGDAMRPAVQYFNKSGTISTFTCQVQTKNREDSDQSAVNLGSAVTVATASGGQVTVGGTNITGCLELVRFRYTLGAASTRWVHFRGLDPLWMPN